MMRKKDENLSTTPVLAVVFLAWVLGSAVGIKLLLDGDVCGRDILGYLLMLYLSIWGLGFCLSDCHWTTAGNDVAARELTALLDQLSTTQLITNLTLK